jgi:hypothetical protein
MHKSFPRRVRKVSFAELGEVGVVLGEELSYFSEPYFSEPVSHEPASKTSF